MATIQLHQFILQQKGRYCSYNKSLGLQIQQFDWYRFQNCSNTFGTVKELYLKEENPEASVFCTVQWFVTLPNQKINQLFDTDWMEMDISVSNILSKVVVFGGEANVDSGLYCNQQIGNYQSEQQCFLPWIPSYLMELPKLDFKLSVTKILPLYVELNLDDFKITNTVVNKATPVNLVFKGIPFEEQEKMKNIFLIGL